MKHKHAELIKAWADGAKIEFRVKGGKWLETVDGLAWKENLEYRIKPEEKKPVVRWLWAYKTNYSDWWKTGEFATEAEAEKYLGENFRYKLEWSRTEFPE